MDTKENVNVVIFSQNVKLESLKKIKGNINNDVCTLFVTPHQLYPNERKLIGESFPKSKYIKFADLLSDSENERCDIEAEGRSPYDLDGYYSEIRKLKNCIIINKLEKKYKLINKSICSDDLGIDAAEWICHGFKIVKLDYFYPSFTKSLNIFFTFKENIRKILFNNTLIVSFLKKCQERRKLGAVTEDVYVAYKDGRKYVFIGKMFRIAYRMDLEWEKSEEEYDRLKRGKFERKEECQYLTTLHESGKCVVPDKRQYDVRYIQDGYLPPNYSSCYLKYKPQNVSYYAWDIVGEKTFKKFDIPVTIMPFRRKMYLPEPVFHSELRTILVATSGPGDWTAQKNRSDEDVMLETFIEIARRFPDVEIIYRCHPTWVHPAHNGVNSIKRVAEYIAYTGLTNIHLSSNIPIENLDDFILSFPRSSLEDDLKKADIVFGEHSVSMLDAGFEQIPFVSVNMTGRRNLFEGISALGFPHCKTVEEIENVLKSYSSRELKKQYADAVAAYNVMTDREDDTAEVHE